MSKYQHRSKDKELLDDLDQPFEAIKQNMKELDFINTYLGGHKITIDGLKSFLPLPIGATICEIGCGGGDNLFALKKYFNSPSIQYIGIDYNENCINYAQSQSRNKGITFIHSTYQDYTFSQKPEVIFSSLFCHHFTDEQLEDQLTWMYDNCTIGFFINDLHRHPFAYQSIKILTRLFSNSYLVKNDAPQSVLRGFTKNEWKNIIEHTAIKTYDIAWKWAFRHLLLIKK